MKYRIQPILDEIRTWIEFYGFNEYEVDSFGEVVYQSDHAMENAPEALILLHKLYHANK